MGLFDKQLETLDEGRVQKFRIGRNAEPLTFADALSLWQRDQSFRSYFMSLLADAPFATYRWETPALTTDTVNRSFEFVLVDTPGLPRFPDRSTFGRLFNDEVVDEGIVAFENLGKDALLVVPSPLGPYSSYAHLAAFTRHAPQPQNHAFWRIVGEKTEQRLSSQPLWLSTAGGGVSWLHVRLDVQPKYYAFSPYKQTDREKGDINEARR